MPPSTGSSKTMSALSRPDLGPPGGVVVDLDRHGGALGHRAAAGDGQPGQRAGRLRVRSWWSSACPSPPRRAGGGTRNRRSGPGRRVRRWPEPPTRTVGASGSGIVGCAHLCGTIVGGRHPKVVSCPPADPGSVALEGASAVQAATDRLRPTECPRPSRAGGGAGVDLGPVAVRDCHRSWPGRDRSARRRSPWPGGRHR